MVSNLVRTIPSMVCGFSCDEWSARAALNFTCKYKYKYKLKIQIQPQLLQIQLYQLVNGLIAHEGFSHKEHQVRPVNGDQLGKRAHQRFVVLQP